MAQCDKNSIPLVNSDIQDDGEQLQRQEVVVLKYLNLSQSEWEQLLNHYVFLLRQKDLLTQFLDSLKNVEMKPRTINSAVGA